MGLAELIETRKSNPSGWGWDPIRCHILADDKSFDDYVKVHTHCKGMNKKPFPQFWALEPVFAKGRAKLLMVKLGSSGMMETRPILALKVKSRNQNALRSLSLFMSRTLTMTLQRK
ncbi:unnamed protein product [Linum trigynum]|uniref:Uncharacterized protein n=1 Tax=Linum trigynum TaxID=586398 RepID=A0AAV2EDD1_9ROSI